MELTDALKFAANHKRGVLTTIKRDGRPQLSNIAYALNGDVFEISITAGRAKYKNLLREPWAALHIAQDDFWAYAVFEGDAEMTAVATEPSDATVEALVDMYRRVAGEHPDWDEYREAMVTDKRVLLSLRPTRSYGMI